MTGEQYRHIIDRLGLNISQAGRFFNVNVRTARRWGETGPSKVVANFLIILDCDNRSIAQVRETLRRYKKRHEIVE